MKATETGCDNGAGRTGNGAAFSMSFGSGENRGKRRSNQRHLFGKFETGATIGGSGNAGPSTLTPIPANELRRNKPIACPVS
jgi:hypothetical protein